VGRRGIVPPAAARAGTSQRDVPTSARLLTSIFAQVAQQAGELSFNHEIEGLGEFRRAFSHVAEVVISERLPQTRTFRQRYSVGVLRCVSVKNQPRSTLPFQGFKFFADLVAILQPGHLIVLDLIFDSGSLVNPQVNLVQ
jgi:hypothetical protein